MTALLAQPQLVCPVNHAILLQVQQALDGDLRDRLSALRLPGLRRQTALETLLFRTWFLLG